MHVRAHTHTHSHNSSRNPAAPLPFYFNQQDFRNHSPSSNPPSSLLSALGFLISCLRQPSSCRLSWSFTHIKGRQQRRGFPAEPRAKQQDAWTRTLSPRNAGLHPLDYILHLELGDIDSTKSKTCWRRRHSSPGRFSEERDCWVDIYLCGL